MIPLHELLQVYFELLSSRPDVRVHQRQVGRAGRLSEADAAALPREVAELYRHIDGLRCWWVFAEDAAEVEDYRAGYNGGLLALPPLASDGVRWTALPGPSGSRDERGLRGTLIDALGDAAQAYLVRQEAEGPDQAYVMYVDDDPTLDQIVIGDFRSYLREGAKNAFALDWQRARHDEEPHAEGVRRRLLARSRRDVGDRAAADAALRARGASPEASASLIEWLGEGVALLLPK